MEQQYDEEEETQIVEFQKVGPMESRRETCERLSWRRRRNRLDAADIDTWLVTLSVSSIRQLNDQR